LIIRPGKVISFSGKSVGLALFQTGVGGAKTIILTLTGDNGTDVIPYSVVLSGSNPPPPPPPGSGNPAKVARGSYPDIAVDTKGNIHLVYGRSSVAYYMKYDVANGTWGAESNTGVTVTNIDRSDPDIVIDSKDNPHVFAGAGYAYWDGAKWNKSNPKGSLMRDTELAIDGNDNVYIVYRGGNNGGYMGISKRAAGSSTWNTLTDPDKGQLGRNDHVYPDLAINPTDNSLHIVYRHGIPKNTSYRFSTDGGVTWKAEGITGVEPESPHLVLDSQGNVYATNGAGDFFRRTTGGWVSEGKAVSTAGRQQPELTIDKNNTIYCGSHGGKYNIRTNGSWGSSKLLTSVTGAKKGFLEMAGVDGFAYAAWEEGSSVNADLGAGTVDIIVGKIDASGNVTGISSTPLSLKIKNFSPEQWEFMGIPDFWSVSSLYTLSGEIVKQSLKQSDIVSLVGMGTIENNLTPGIYLMVFTYKNNERFLKKVVVK